MVSRIATKQFVKFAVPALLAVFCVAQALPAAARTGRVRAITKPKFDPNAKQVGLFQGIKDGSLTAQLILKNSIQGKYRTTRPTDPLRKEPKGSPIPFIHTPARHRHTAPQKRFGSKWRVCFCLSSMMPVRHPIFSLVRSAWYNRPVWQPLHR